MFNAGVPEKLLDKSLVIRALLHYGNMREPQKLSLKQQESQFHS